MLRLLRSIWQKMFSNLRTPTLITGSWRASGSSRRAFARALDNQGPLRLVMEACGSAHYWARRFVSQGHTLRLLPARDVRLMCGATRRTVRMRPVCSKLIAAPRSMQCRSSRRNSRVCRRCTESASSGKRNARPRSTCCAACCESSALSFHWVPRKVRPAVLAALEDGDNELPMQCCASTLGEMLDRLAELTRAMNAIEQQLQVYAHADPVCQRYQQAPGIGVLTATALRASAGPLERFRSGRHLAAWMGLAPREHSSGNQRRLGRISKRGDGYLRMLLIHGARATLRAARVREQHQQSLNRLQIWALTLQQRVGHNKAAVALANKTSRGACGRWNITTSPSTPTTSACGPNNPSNELPWRSELMANVSVPNRIKPITLLACEAALNDWLSIRGFHDGPSVVRSPQGRIHDCNRLHSPVRRASCKSITCTRSPYTNS